MARRKAGKRGGTPDDVIMEFERARPDYIQFTSKLETLLCDILDRNKIDSEAIQSRTKTVDGFAAKIQRPGKDYVDPLSGVTDISGVRIILYYLEDVDRVAHLIESEFTIDRENSVDKGQILKPHEFGYRSVHYVISLAPPRSELTEWKAFTAFKAEIQIRTVLQHAWAAVSRSLDYTQKEDVPSSLRRRLFRLSGLFEIADEEFSNLHAARERETGEISRSLERGEKGIELNLDSLRGYLKTSDLIKQISKEAHSIGFTSVHSDTYAPQLLVLCRDLGLQTIDDLARTLKAVSNRVAKYLKAQFKASTGAWGVSQSFLLALILVGYSAADITTDDLVRLNWNKTRAETAISVAKKNPIRSKA